MTSTRDGRPATPDGLVIVDKPAGWTSHDVVGRMRRLAGTRRVGHAGTLDPMATGVLVLGVNRATKLLTFLVGSDKQYSAAIRLGQSTLTDDAEGEVLASVDASHVTPDSVREAVRALTGDIQQVPSSVSAIKVNGERSYARVRGGQDVELAARPVTVTRFDVLGLHSADERFVDVDVEVEVSSGTYVRALARDLGGALGVGGHLTMLRRTRVGRFGLSDAHSLEALGADVEAGRPLPVIPMADAAAASFPVHHLEDSEVRALSYGQRINSSTPNAPVTAALAPDGRLAAILDETASRARSKVTFPEL